MLKRLYDLFGLGRIGWLEMAIALYPIIGGYGYGAFKLSFGFLMILDIFLIRKNRITSINFQPITVYFIFIMVHRFLWLFVMPSVPSYFINSWIADIIYLLSLIIITPHIDFCKLKNSINLVAIICIIGMLYHVAMIQAGQQVSPIKLPFMPEMASQSRLYAVMQRPTSFFWEPQSYSSFMLVPLFYALKDKRFPFALIIAASMIVSTSTTGIFMAIFMVAFYSLTQKQKLVYRLVGILAIVGLVYFLLNSTYATSGLEKLQSTNLEENNRTINGVLIAQSMNLSDWLFGVPYANLQDAYEADYINKNLIIYGDGEVFVSAFWICLCCQGLIGLFFFLNIYWQIFKVDKNILPYMICIIVGLFSNPDILGVSYIFQLIIMFTFVSYNSEFKNKTIQII